MQEVEEGILFNLVRAASVFVQLIQLFEEDFTLGITDREKFLVYYPGDTLRFPIQKADKFGEQSLAGLVIHSNKPLTKVMDKTLYGVTYLGGGMPIVENGKTVGSLVFGVSMDRRHQLMEISEHLASLVEEVMSSTTSLNEAAQKIASRNTALREFMEPINESIKKTSSFAELIKRIADQSHLLGLNAQIEAARAGEHGRGFGVVAQEIKNLGSNSIESTKMITELVGRIQTDLQELQALLSVSESDTFSHFGALSDLSEVMELMSEEAQKIASLATI